MWSSAHSDVYKSSVLCLVLCCAHRSEGRPPEVAALAAIAVRIIENRSLESMVPAYPSKATKKGDQGTSDDLFFFATACT